MTRYRVNYHMAAKREWESLPASEKAAITTAIKKLEFMGPTLSFPHQSKVRGSSHLRELRPRAGRSMWRPLYAQVGSDMFVVAAIAPEAVRDARRFRRSVRRAEQRLGHVK